MHQHFSKLRKYWRGGKDSWVGPFSILYSGLITVFVVRAFGFGVGVQLLSFVLLCLGFMYGLALYAYHRDTSRVRNGDQRS